MIINNNSSNNNINNNSLLVSHEDSLFGEEAKLLMKQQWIKRKLRECKSKYSIPSHQNIFCGTWNVNGKERLNEESLSEWLLPSGHPSYDIYILGFQEIVPLTPVNIAVDPLGPYRTQYWLTNIENCLRESDKNYRLIGAKNLVGILLCIFVVDRLYDEISDVRWTTTPVGVMGVMGNKGAVVVRFNLHSTSICIVCAHLAAARENIQGRNNDYRNIMERTLLIRDHQSHNFPTKTSLSGQFNLQDERSICSILDHEIVFWIGDFNYRIDVSLNLEEIMNHIWCENITFLRKKDQLNIERALGNVFQGFEEAPLTFLPTYKYIVGTDIYDTRPDKKLRPPAWCDRILWRDLTTEGAGAIISKTYRKTNLKTSDHKPVSASFILESRVVDGVLELVEYDRLRKEVESLQSSARPEVEIGPVEFHHEKIRYQERREKFCYIRNTGMAGVSWRFIPKNNDVLLSKQWIHIEPVMGIISPGETVRITIEVFVDYRSLELVSQSFEEFSEELTQTDTTTDQLHWSIRTEEPRIAETVTFEENVEEIFDESFLDFRATFTPSMTPIRVVQLVDILILRIENGKDYFLTVSAEFGPTPQDIATMRQQQSQIDQFHTTISALDSRHTSFDESNAGYELLDPSSFGCLPTYNIPKEIKDKKLRSFNEEDESKDSNEIIDEPKLARKSSRRHSIRISRTNDNSHLLKETFSLPTPDEI